MMRSGSTSAMFQNSISDSNSKKKMSRQKTSSVLKTIPYSMSQNMLGSTMSTSNPTITMFNSIINSQKSHKQRKKTTSKKKKRDSGTSSSDRGIKSYSKFRNTFLSMYDYSSPTAAPSSTKVQTTSAALKKMLDGSKKQLQDVNTVIINS